MPTITIHPSASTHSSLPSPLPGLLQTPLGLAILELQGTINFPAPDLDASSDASSSTNIGSLVFPDYDASTESQEGPWMRRVWFYVGHQRMTGEVKKLKKPMGVLRRKAETKGDEEGAMGENRDGWTAEGQSAEELEIIEVVRWKLVFSSRPEPVGLIEI